MVGRDHIHDHKVQSVQSQKMYNRFLTHSQMIIAGPCASGLQVARRHHFQQRCNQWHVSVVNEWQRALSLFKHVNDLRLDATIITFGAAISACESGAQWHRATETQTRLPFVLHSVKSALPSLAKSW